MMNQEGYVFNDNDNKKKWLLRKGVVCLFFADGTGQVNQWHWKGKARENLKIFFHFRK